MVAKIEWIKAARAKVLQDNSRFKRNVYQSPPNFPFICGSEKLYQSFFNEVKHGDLPTVPSWGGNNVQAFAGQYSNSVFSRWNGQICGQLGFSSSAIFPQQWSTCVFTRSLASKSKLDRKKRDLARREFQLLRRRTKLLKATMTPEERLRWRLRKSNRKKAVLLQRLKKYELEEDPEPVHDPELITQEQLQAFKKIGYKNRNYVPVGRRGVYGGVVQNMHMHWKFHETVQVDCHIFKQEDVRTVASQLAVLSGGIVIDIHQSTNIIMYRGRNYKQPKTEMIPPNTLTKRKALFKSKYLQALEGLEKNIQNIEAELQILQRKQKEGLQEGTAGNTNEVRQATEYSASISMDKLDETSSDDDDLFKWDTDSLDEDELSDDDNYKKAEEIDIDKTAVIKPFSWSLEDTAKRPGKKNPVTVKELITAEQELFKEHPLKEHPKRHLDGGQKKGSDLADDDDDELKTDDDDDKDIHRHIGERNNGVRNGELNGMQSSLCNDKDRRFDVKKALRSDHNYKVGIENGKKPAKMFEAGSRGNMHEQIKNKKIANFAEFITDEDSDEDEESGSGHNNQNMPGD